MSIATERRRHVGRAPRSPERLSRAEWLAALKRSFSEFMKDDFTTAGIFLLIVVGGDLGNAIAKKAHLGGAFDWVWGILRWPTAFCARACSRCT